MSWFTFWNPFKWDHALTAGNFTPVGIPQSGESAVEFIQAAVLIRGQKLFPG
jgi:hypothetical protein